MSKFYYIFHIGEVNENEENIVVNLPHHDIIKKWIPEEWDKCNIHTTFDGILAGKVVNTTLKVIKNKKKETECNVCIEMAQGVRLTEKYRSELIDQMAGQVTDGFGESIDYNPVPGVKGYRIFVY